MNRLYFAEKAPFVFLWYADATDDRRFWVISNERVGTLRATSEEDTLGYNLANLTKRTRHKNQKGKTCLSVTANMLFAVFEYKGL